MPRLPPSPRLRFDAAGLIHGEDFADSYFSRDDGLAETRTVFLTGNHLPDAWQGKSSFVIGELGFGTGLNVLACWDLWRKTGPSDAILHIITVEGFLMEAEHAALAHRQWPELACLSEKLLARWPTRMAGTQRLWFDEDRLCLTVLIGPCEEALARADFHADCWFLDGFAPSRNPDMWSPQVMEQIKRLSKPGARAATYSVSGLVRSGMSAVGFDVTRKPGFGTKRQRLEAQLPARLHPVSASQPRTAIVIGGGIGGAATCQALARRNIACHVFDADPCGRTKASGNPLALVIPRLDKGDTREARFYQSAYLMAIDQYHALGESCFEPTGVIEGGEDEAARKRLGDLLADPPWPEAHLIAGQNETLFHTSAGIAYPDQILARLKEKAQRHPVQIARIAPDGDQWCAYDAHDTLCARADICVIAAGTGISKFHDFSTDMGARAGQLTWAHVAGALPEIPVSGAGYGAQFGDRLAFGATYARWPSGAETPPPVDFEGHIHNQSVLGKIAPDLAARIDLTTASGRTSIRVTTSDQMPIAGRMPDAPEGLYVVAGLGSRGFTTAFLCAELVAAQACGEPIPVEAAICEALAPDRFAKRRAKRGKS
jgi:tRNA 5-methylaminomethyl-2-thiouridine biosynthesis bifunctional protein